MIILHKEHGLLIKARSHKYYKRIKKGNGWRYFYTEAEYKKYKSGNEKEKSENKKIEKKENLTRPMSEVLKYPVNASLDAGKSMSAVAHVVVNGESKGYFPIKNVKSQNDLSNLSVYDSIRVRNNNVSFDENSKTFQNVSKKLEDMGFSLLMRSDGGGYYVFVKSKNAMVANANPMTRDLVEKQINKKDADFGNVKDVDVYNDYGIKIMDKSFADKEQKETVLSILKDIFSVFGDRKSLCAKNGLKIGEIKGAAYRKGGEVGGFYSPSNKSIFVAMRDARFGFSLVHEFAHFIDHSLSYASDKDGSLSNQIADMYRRNTGFFKKNKNNSAAKYFNGNTECFARALEQYFAYKAGKNKYLYMAEDFFDEKSNVEQKTFKKYIMPLVEQFFKDNDSLLKSMIIEIL